MAILTFVFFGTAMAATLKTQKAKETPVTQKAAPAAQAMVRMGPAETISGTLKMVVPHKRLMILTDSAGTPFDFRVTPATHIAVSGKNVRLSDLRHDVNKSVSVKFVPLRLGDVARSIKVSS
jgi:hypothetical protein